MRHLTGCLTAALLFVFLPASVRAQHEHGTPARALPHVQPHTMTMKEVGGGWMAIGMAQLFPIGTIAVPSETGTPLVRKGLYLTQPVLMLNLESPGSRIVLKATPNFEGLTQPGGELSYGGWGEGFLDKRHPHTLLHEVMFSINLFGAAAAWSLSAGKGFAPYGTDDPMSRPAVKYPTNHHLSQVLERFVLTTAVARKQWSLEFGIFGGSEPEGPYDLSNIESFPDSWSGRITRRFGQVLHGTGTWELSGSYARVREEHEGEGETTQLFNAALRHDAAHATSRVYALAEVSFSRPEEGSGFYSALVEGRVQSNRHAPYGRIEFARRPEFERDGPPGSRRFFRYDHDHDPSGATRWWILTAGYGYEATRLPFSVRPFVEAQFQSVAEDLGGIRPEVLFGRDRFFTFSAGLRIFLGGEPMRMGAYGVLDPMTLMHREMMTASTQTEHHH